MNPQDNQESLRDEIDWAFIEHGVWVLAKVRFAIDPEVYEEAYKPATHDDDVDALVALIERRIALAQQEARVDELKKVVGHPREGDDTLADTIYGRIAELEQPNPEHMESEVK